MKSRFDKLEMTTEVNSLLTTATPSAVDGDGGNAPPPPWRVDSLACSTQLPRNLEVLILTYSELFWEVSLADLIFILLTNFIVYYTTIYKSQYQPVIVNLKILLDKSDYGEGITEILNSHWSVISLPPTNIVLEKPSHQFLICKYFQVFKTKNYIKLTGSRKVPPGS